MWLQVNQCFLVKLRFSCLLTFFYYLTSVLKEYGLLLPQWRGLFRIDEDEKHMSKIVVYQEPRANSKQDLTFITKTLNK